MTKEGRPAVTAYACRYDSGRLREVPPGRTRRELYCPHCRFRPDEQGCLFFPGQPPALALAAAKRQERKYRYKRRKNRICRYPGCHVTVTDESKLQLCNRHATWYRHGHISEADLEPRTEGDLTGLGGP